MTQQAPQAGRPKTVEDLAREIVIEAGAEGIEVPGIPKAVWFRGPWTTVQPNGQTAEGTDIRHGDTFPLNPSLVVFRMFEDAEEIRVYCLAVSKTASASKNDGTDNPACYKLRTGSPVYTVHTMSLSLFRDEVAKELQALAGLDNDEPDFDVVECPACHVEVPELPYCGSCGVKLPEEQAPAANGTTTPAAPAVTP